MEKHHSINIIVEVTSRNWVTRDGQAFGQNLWRKIKNTIAVKVTSQPNASLAYPVNKNTVWKELDTMNIHGHLAITKSFAKDRK